MRSEKILLNMPYGDHVLSVIVAQCAIRKWDFAFRRIKEINN